MWQYKNIDAKGIQFFHNSLWFLIFLLYQILYVYKSIAKLIVSYLFCR